MQITEERIDGCDRRASAEHYREFEHYLMKKPVVPQQGLSGASPFKRLLF